MTDEQTGSESPSGHLVSARQITPERHAGILGDLRRALDLLKAKGITVPGVAELRVRDWWIEMDEGRPCLEIYLDKGYRDSPKAPGGLEAETRLTLDECMEFHAFLMETDVLDVFSEAIEVRVGSPGGEPPLREEVDFRSCVGCMVSLQTWTKRENRDKFVMLLHEVDSIPEGVAAILKEGNHAFPIPLKDVKVAQALPHHPQSLLSKKGKSPKRK